MPWGDELMPSRQKGAPHAQWRYDSFMIDPALSWAHPSCIMPVISRLLAAGRSFIRRRPWAAAVLILVLLYFLTRGCYLLLAPEDAWLDQGWLALRNGRYAEAEQCFLRAQGKGPRDVLPRLALLTMFAHEQAAEPKPVGYFGQWDGLPGLGHSLKSMEAYWGQARVRHARRALPLLDHWGDAQFGERGIAEGLFYDYWMVYPREVREVVAIMHEVESGQPARAWADYDRLRRRNPRICHNVIAHQQRCYRYPLQAAWHTHHFAEMESIVLPLFTAPDPKEFQQEFDLLHNARLGLAPQVTARVWSVRDGALAEDLRPAREHSDYRLLLASARQGAQLFASPSYACPTPQRRRQCWWQWSEADWHEAAPDAQHLLGDFFQAPLPRGEQVWPTLCAAWGAEAPDASYLVLRKTDTNGRMSLLLRQDAHGTQRLGGHSPFEIQWLNGDLWLHEERGFSRSAPDLSCTLFEGNTVSREGSFFASAQTLPPLPMTLSGAWQLAKDGAGHLWLVSWEGQQLRLCARWTGTTFRPPSAAEQQAAAPGFLDAGGRIWCTTELPHGFQRDAWRRVPGLPRHSGAAQYAVDGKGRVWMISGRILARWDGHWASVADAIPGLPVETDTLLAAGNGVLITFGNRVGYLQ